MKCKCIASYVETQLKQLEMQHKPKRIIKFLVNCYAYQPLKLHNVTLFSQTA